MGDAITVAPVARRLLMRTVVRNALLCSLLVAASACDGSFVVTSPPGASDVDAAPGGGADASTDPAAQARAAFETDVLPILNTACKGCHSLDDGNGWMVPAPDVYTHMTTWPLLINPATPSSSQLVTKGQHAGPAFTTAQAQTVAGWLALEQVAHATGDGGSTVEAITVVDGANTIPLDALGATGSSLTFTAQRLTQGLYLSRIAVVAGTDGLHITHPLFVTWVDDVPSPDPVDSFDRVDLDVATGARGDVGGGLLMLASVPMNARLSVTFKAIGKATGGGGTTTLPGCKAVTAFTTSARGPLQTSCASCHAGGNAGATNATDMTKLADTSATGQAAACGQILGRVDLATPAASGIFVSVDPAAGANHPFKFASAAAFTAFKNSLSTWIQAEQAAP